MCGETLSDAVVVERRNGPQRLRANDDELCQLLRAPVRNALFEPIL